MISVIIPIYNEEKALQNSASFFDALSKRAEVIFVDGGSFDKSRVFASVYGKVVQCPKGRALQMNTGARLSKGDALFFLHADTSIGLNTLSAIEEAIDKKGFVGGCLTQRIDSGSFIYRLIEAQGNRRARRRKIFYGDQGIFVKKETFFDLGCFPEIPIMEDVLFARQLRKSGATVVLPDKIIVSARRWEKRGRIKTTFLFILIIALFYLKLPLPKIKQLYEDLR